MQPARSYSPLRYMPGICAVSPPIKAQPAARHALAKPAQELIEDPRLQFFRSDVIEKEKRPRAEDGDVVDAMVHEIGADGVVPIHGESDLQFRADAIDARDQHRLAHAGEVRRKQSAEAADLSENFGPVRLPNESLDAALQPIAEIDVNAGARVSLFLLCHPERSEDLAIVEKFLAVNRND